MSWDVIQGDCLEAMKDIPDGSIDACITDPPYGTTACSWDSVIPFAPMWAALKRVVKKNGAIVLFGSQPFTSALVMSNPQMFRHEWVWEKSKAASFALCNVRPLQVTEYITVFSNAGVIYNPQMAELSSPYTRVFEGNKIFTERHETAPLQSDLPAQKEYTHSYPRNAVRFSSVFDGKAHPTQKPVELMRYLVRTYTNTGDTVLDFTCGSGSTGVACAIERRSFIGIESDPHYVEVSRARISRACGVPADIPTCNKPERDLPLFAA